MLTPKQAELIYRIGSGGAIIVVGRRRTANAQVREGGGGGCGGARTKKRVGAGGRVASSSSEGPTKGGSWAASRAGRSGQRAKTAAVALSDSCEATAKGRSALTGTTAEGAGSSGPRRCGVTEDTIATIVVVRS